MSKIAYLSVLEQWKIDLYPCLDPGLSKHLTDSYLAHDPRTHQIS